jgi:hypothetical protein
LESLLVIVSAFSDDTGSGFFATLKPKRASATDGGCFFAAATSGAGACRTQASTETYSYESLNYAVRTTRYESLNYAVRT